MADNDLMVAVPEEHGAPVPSPPPAVSQLDADMLELSRPYRLQGLKGAFESFVVSFGGEINVSCFFLGSFRSSLCLSGSFSNLFFVCSL